MAKKVLYRIVLAASIVSASLALCEPPKRGNYEKGGYESLAPWISVGGPGMSGWKGLAPSGGASRLSLPGEASFSFNSQQNWFENYGLRLDVIVPAGRVFEGEIVLNTPPLAAVGNYRSQMAVTRATFSIPGGEDAVDLPFSAFDHHFPFTETFQMVKKMVIKGKFQDGKPGDLTIKSVRVIRAPRLKLYTKCRSRVGEKNEIIEYDLKVMNCSDRIQFVHLKGNPYSKHVTKAIITPEKLALNPGETRSCHVKVDLTDRIPPGGRERQRVVAIANGSLGGQIEFITGRRLPHPYLNRTREEWDEIRRKTDAARWEAKNAERLETDRHPHLLGEAWQITRNRKYAEKAKRSVLSSVNKRRNDQDHSLISAVELYDTIFDSGVFSRSEQERIEEAFHGQMKGIGLNGVANLELLAAKTGYTIALCLQDFAWFEYFLYANNGVYDNIANGILPDGWWFEGVVNYNNWVSRYILMMAKAARPFGINLVDAYYTPVYSGEFRQLPEDVETRKKNHGGKPFQTFGKHARPMITLDMLWDCVLPHLAHDGTIFAANDAPGFKYQSHYWLGYEMYKKPEYAAVLKTGDLTGEQLAALPEDTPPIGVKSGYSDAVGFATLRSQTADRHPSEQISATLKYGTHGGYHGHFDRTAFNSMIRHNRSFYGSGHSINYVYASFMYGFYVQSTANHNIVTVDSRNQEPVESDRLLFHTDGMMQAAVVQTDARWCNPPYAGLAMGRRNRKPGEPAAYSGGERFAAEDLYMPIPVPEPRPASIGEYSERILQRRLMVVTDDYVVLADYMKGKEPHVYDNLLQIRGFRTIAGEGVELDRHTDQMGTNPLLGSQLVTHCNWYRKNGTSKAGFHVIYDDHSSQYFSRLHGDKGDLFINVYSAWPKDNEVMVGTAPAKGCRVGYTTYKVLADNVEIAGDAFSPWILGRHEIDIPLKQGVKVLTLSTKVENRRMGGFSTPQKRGLFWGGGVIEAADGKTVTLSQLEAAGKLTYDRIVVKNDKGDAMTPGKDFFGGPVKIQGRVYTETVPAQPHGQGSITIDLAGLNAVRFRADIGSDFPHGDEKYQNSVYSSRVKGETARFLTVIEPFESRAMVGKVTALSADKLRVELKNGKVQDIEIAGFEGNGENIEVNMIETRDGRVLRQTSTRSPGK